MAASAFLIITLLFYGVCAVGIYCIIDEIREFRKEDEYKSDPRIGQKFG